MSCLYCSIQDWTVTGPEEYCRKLGVRTELRGTPALTDQNKEECGKKVL